MATQDAWRETCLIDITKQGGSNVRFQALTETVDIDLADKDIEGVALVNGGRIAKYTPQGDTTITFEAYCDQAGTSSGTISSGFFDLMNTADASQPISIVNDRVRDQYRVAVLWTDLSTVLGASDAVTSGNGRRFVGANGYITSVKDSFTDGILKTTAIFKVTAFDKSGNGQMKWESVSNSAGTLTALAAFTSSVKW